VWPGDTFGITVLPRDPHGTPGSDDDGTRLSLTWGSAIPPSKNSEIYAAVVAFRGRAG
jgi:hypothetical protein